MADPRMFRAIVLGGASLVGTTALGVICDACGSGETAGPICQTSTSFYSPCGVESVTTTCSGTTTSCDPSPNQLCSVGPVQADCSVTVVLGDGTSHTFPVTVGQKQGCTGDVVTSESPSFASATCKAPPPTFDASADVETDALDESTDASDSAFVDVADANGD